MSGWGLIQTNSVTVAFFSTTGVFMSNAAAPWCANDGLTIAASPANTIATITTVVLTSTSRNQFRVAIDRWLPRRIRLTGRIGHLFQVSLHRRRDAGEVEKCLAWNPSEGDDAETERPGVKLRVIHGHRQRQ